MFLVYVLTSCLARETYCTQEMAQLTVFNIDASFVKFVSHIITYDRLANSANCYISINDGDTFIFENYKVI